MLKAATSIIPSALIALDGYGNVSKVYITKHSMQKLQYLLGKQFIRILRLVFGAQKADIIYEGYRECADLHNDIELIKLKHTNTRGLVEYFNWHFFSGPESGVILFVQNVTESFLIEEEFTCMAEQYEAVNRELYVSMSKLDFHLMDIEQAHKKIAALYRITSIVQKTVNEQEVLEEILDGITREFGYSDVSILLLDEGSNELKVRASRGNANASISVPLGNGIIGFAAVQRELVYVDDVNTDSTYIANNDTTARAVIVPLIVNDKLLGVLDVEVSKERVIQPYDLDLLRSLSSQIAMTIAHAKHVANVEFQAITDGMTGLYNYRYFRTILQQEFKRAVRYSRPLTLFMIDIDHFKHYNDTNGHPMGDKVLQMVASIIKRVCRDTDFVFRYGGEEFVVLLPETQEFEAFNIAERIRGYVAGHQFPNQHTQPGGILTISIGVAGYPDSACSDIELIDRADAALYLAKRVRNTSCLPIFSRYD